MAQASWSSAPLDPFFNINTPEDLAKAGAWVAAGHRSSKETPTTMEATHHDKA
jgi:hypothetical protein